MLSRRASNLLDNGSTFIWNAYMAHVPWPKTKWSNTFNDIYWRSFRSGWNNNNRLTTGSVCHKWWFLRNRQTCKLGYYMFHQFCVITVTLSSHRSWDDKPVCKTGGKPGPVLEAGWFHCRYSEAHTLWSLDVVTIQRTIGSANAGGCRWLNAASRCLMAGSLSVILCLQVCCYR